MASRNVWIGGCVVAIVMAAASAHAQSTFGGTFVIAADARQLAAITQAVAAATNSLPLRERTHWRTQLDEMTRPAPRLSIRQAGTDFVVVDGAGIELKSPTNASPVLLRGEWQLDQRLINGVLEQRIENGIIGQVHRYTISADGNTLVLSVRITAAALLLPITYTVTYRRQDSASSVAPR